MELYIAVVMSSQCRDKMIKAAFGLSNKYPYGDDRKRTLTVMIVRKDLRDPGNGSH